MHKFSYENEYDGYEPRKITMEVGSDASLTEMLECFADYLKACGFGIRVGDYLDFVNDGIDEEDKSWDSFFNKEEGVTEDFNPRSSIDDATYDEWNKAYKNVTVTCNGVKFQEHD